MIYDAVENDTATVLSLTLRDKDNLTALNLTGCSVNAIWRDKSGTLITAPMTIKSATAGTVEYKFTAGQLQAPCMTIEIVITDALGANVTSLKTIDLKVRSRL